MFNCQISQMIKFLNEGAYDGLGGTLKREAAKYSLSQVYENQILTPRDFFKFCQERCPGIVTFFVSKSDIQDQSVSIQRRFERSKTLKGTRGFHSFESKHPLKLIVKTFSSSSRSYVKNIVKQ